MKKRNLERAAVWRPSRRFGHIRMRDQAPLKGFSCIEVSVRLTLDETWLLVPSKAAPKLRGQAGG